MTDDVLAEYQAAKENLLQKTEALDKAMGAERKARTRFKQAKEALRFSEGELNERFVQLAAH